MLTYQDYEKEPDKAKFITQLISEHQNSDAYKIAKEADAYDRQKNVTINEFIKKLFTSSGIPVQNFVATNNKLASNFFRRLNKQRCTYSMGNGLTFTVEGTKDKLGIDADKKLSDAAYKALIHGVSFVFWNLDHMHVFPLTEFAPLWDEETGALRAGVRYWRIDTTKPTTAILYEEDGLTKYRSKSTSVGGFEEVEQKRGYIRTTSMAAADEHPAVVGEENYGVLPIVPMWGSELHQSTLVGMKQSIDSYDIIRSGFANDMQDCAEIYWLLENYGGMSNDDLMQLRDRLLLQHMAVVDTQAGGKITPYTQEVPYQARGAYLDRIRAGLYEDFGGLDVSSIASGSRTATEINAAYQPLDENADDFEYQIIECVQQILRVAGLPEDTPTFKRNRISNQYEQAQMVMLEAEYLDDETILNKLPNISPDEVENILERRTDAEQSRFVRNEAAGGESAREGEA